MNYTWDFDDGNFAWVEDPLHTFEDYGTFDVTLTVRDDDGLEAVATLTIYVNAPPVPVIDAQPLELLAGESVSFDGSPSWDPDGTIQFLDREFDPGVVQEEGFNLLQQPSGAMTELGLPPAPAPPSATRPRC